MTDDALDELAKYLRDLRDRARALLAAQEPRPEPDKARELLAQMRREHDSHHYHECPYDDAPCNCFIGPLHASVDAFLAAPSPAQEPRPEPDTRVEQIAAPSPAQQTMAAECEHCRDKGCAVCGRYPSTPAVEIDERLREFGYAPGHYQCPPCISCGKQFADADKRAVRCERCALRLALIAERQRAADDARERALLKWCVDRAEAYFDPDAFGITGVPGRYMQFADAVEAARPVFNAMSAQGDA